MPKVDDRPMFRVGKWSISQSSAKEIEDWMNLERQDYHMDQTIREGDTLIIILYLSHRFRRRRGALTPEKTTKKKAGKKEATK